MTHILSAHINNQPLFAAPEMEGQLDSCVKLFSELPHAAEMLAAPIQADEGFWPEPGSWMAQVRPYEVDSSGTLSIPIKGMLLNDFGFATQWATGYQYVQKAWDRGMADPNVKLVELNVNSGGGLAAGNADLADHMAATKTKPVIANVENSYSAAYAISSPADIVNVTRTGGCGSIGCVMGHMDVSGALEQAGLKFTKISSPEGGDKAEGDGMTLSADTRARMQARSDELYSHFASSVARNRGLDVQAIHDMKARTFTASQSVANGLADTVSTRAASLASFKADLSSNDGELNMSTETDGTVAKAAHEAAVTTARTEGHVAGRAEGHTAGLTEGAQAERSRISTILASDAAKDRPVAALAAAMDTALSVDAAAAFLAKLPKESAQVATETTLNTTGTGFDAAMGGNRDNPNLGAGGGSDVAKAIGDPADASALLALVHSTGTPGFAKRESN